MATFSLSRVGRGLLLLAFGLVGSTDSILCAGDWPQILGPTRSAIALQETLRREWNAAPLKLWELPVGTGFAGVVAQGDMAIVFHRIGREERLTAIDRKTGKVLWERGFPTAFQAAIVDDDGPRATPAITRDAVVAYGAEGRLVCVERSTGAVRWQRETHREFAAPPGYFGAGSSPLVEGDRVIVNVGGPKGAGVVAFAIADGKTVWQSSNELASYASPIQTTLGGQPRTLVVTRMQLLGLETATGREKFRIPFGQRGPTVNAALPVFVGDELWLTASYGIGAKGIRVTADSAEIAWEDESLSSQYTTPVVADGSVYGIDGRQDGGPVSLKCLDGKTRQPKWEKTGIVYATLIAADGLLLVMHTDGVLRVVELSPQAYRELGTAKLLPGTTRALPALSAGRLLIRNEKTLACFDVSASRPAE